MLINNIAQNQSFAQKGIGVKYKTMQNGPPFQNLAITCHYAYFSLLFQQQTILLSYKKLLKSILELHFFYIIPGLIFFHYCNYIFKKILYNFRLFYQNFLNP